MRPLLAGLLGFAGVLLVADSANAQPERVTLQGQFLGLAPLAMTFRTPMGDMLASLEPNRTEGNLTFRAEGGVRYSGVPDPKVEVTGTASADALVKGLMVRFAVDMEKGKAVSDVTEITVLGINPVPGMQYGLLPDGLPPAPLEEEGGKAPPRAKPKTLPEGKHLAIGQITKISRLGITIAFPGGTLNAKLAEEVAVILQANDIRLASPGDAVEVQGLLVRPGKVMAMQVTVIHTPKLAEEGPNRPGVATKKGGPNKPEEGFGVGDPRENEPAGPAATPAAEGPARPKTKGNILKIG